MIEYRKKDDGDKAVYAFRHASISNLSMLITLDWREGFAIGVNVHKGHHTSYGEAFKSISAVMGRLESRAIKWGSTTAVPALDPLLIEADPAVLMQQGALRKGLMHAPADFEKLLPLHRSHIIAALSTLDLMISADKLADLEGRLVATDHRIKNQRYMQPYIDATFGAELAAAETARVAREAEEEAAATERYRDQLAHITKKASETPDWGSW